MLILPHSESLTSQQISFFLALQRNPKPIFNKINSFVDTRFDAAKQANEGWKTSAGPILSIEHTRESFWYKQIQIDHKHQRIFIINFWFKYIRDASHDIQTADHICLYVSRTLSNGQSVSVMCFINRNISHYQNSRIRNPVTNAFESTSLLDTGSYFCCDLMKKPMWYQSENHFGDTFIAIFDPPRGVSKNKFAICIILLVCLWGGTWCSFLNRPMLLRLLPWSRPTIFSTQSNPISSDLYRESIFTCPSIVPILWNEFAVAVLHAIGSLYIF